MMQWLPDGCEMEVDEEPEEPDIEKGAGKIELAMSLLKKDVAAAARLLKEVVPWRPAGGK